MFSFYEELASVLEIKESALTDDYSFQEDGEWDSILMISTISIIDKYFGIVLDYKILNTIQNLGQLKKYLQEIK